MNVNLNQNQNQDTNPNQEHGKYGDMNLNLDFNHNKKPYISNLCDRISRDLQSSKKAEAEVEKTRRERQSEQPLLRKVPN